MLQHGLMFKYNIYAQLIQRNRYKAIDSKTCSRFYLLIN